MDTLKTSMRVFLVKVGGVSRLRPSCEFGLAECARFAGVTFAIRPEVEG